jgi:hypothetical protein
MLEKAAVFDPTIRFGDVGSLKLQPLVQARWTLTERSQTPPGERNTVVGFSVPRARLIVTTNLFDFATAVLRVGARSNGTASFEQAFVDLKWKDFTLRSGQFFLFLNAADDPAPQDLSTVDYSSYASTFSGGQTQGAQLSWNGPLRAVATIGNGARTGFAEILSPLVADIAGTGRIELPIGQNRVSGFGTESSFRKGQGVSARIGAHGHAQTKGSASTNTYSAEFVGGDVSVHGSGWSALASASYMRLSSVGVPTVEDFGFLLFASVFPARRVELWTQFDAVIPIGAKAAHPAGFAGGQVGTTPFRTLSTGANFFIVPDVNRLKVQLDVSTMFDGQVTSIVAPNASNGILATPGAQVAGRVQLVVAL